jgi:nitrogen PTS system EIIA component
MYLNVVQLAESLGVEESVIEGWVRKERLPAVEDRGRLLFDRAQVVEWAAERGLVAKSGFLAPARESGGGLSLEGLLRAGGIWRDLPASAVLPTLEAVLSKLPGASPEVRRMLTQRLHAPGGVTWAPVGGGLALPHLRSPVALGRNAGLLALLLLREPMSLPEPPADGLPLQRLLFFVAPSPRAHLELLSQLSMSLTRGELNRLIRNGAPDQEILACLSTGDPSAEQEMVPR